MELLVYTSIYREKFREKHFLCENDLLLCLLEGAFTVKYEGKERQVEENQAFLFRKGVRHERHALRPMKLMLFRYVSEEPLFSSEHLVFSDTQRFRSTLFMAEKCAMLTDAARLRSHLLLDLSAQYSLEQQCRIVERERDAEMLAAEKRIRESVTKGISVAALARESSLSHVQLIRRFRAAFGCTPSERIKQLRLERAKELLMQTAMPIKEIAYSCGFENEYYFSNFFKKNTGLSPTDFRETTV